MHRSRGYWTRAVVTGASSGIGEAFARRLAAGGSNLVIVARREDRLRKLADDLEEAHGIDVEVHVADLADPEQVRAVEDLFHDPAKPIDLLVNNAGGGEYGLFGERTPDGVMHDAQLNAIAVLRLTHAAVRHMAKRSNGTIIQVSAGVAYYPVPGGAVYGASKAFVNHLSEAVAFELQDSGVGITVVNPGFTRTEGPLRVGFTYDSVPKPLWQEPEDVVECSLRAAVKGKTVVTPGALNKIGRWIGHHAPHRMTLPVIVRSLARYRRPRGMEGVGSGNATGARTRSKEEPDAEAPSGSAARDVPARLGARSRRRTVSGRRDRGARDDLPD